MSAAPPVARSWIEILAPSFPRLVQERGRLYFRAGRVRITRGGASGVEAAVRGSRTYTVRIALQGNGVGVACTCPHYLPLRNPCKHIWASLLAAEAKGLLADLGGPVRDPGAGGPEAAPDPDPEVLPPLEDDHLDGDDAYDRWTPPTPTGEPAWKRRLAAISLAHLDAPERGDAIWPAGRELLYVVDVPASREGRGLALDILHRQARKDGSWSAPRPQKVTRQLSRALPDPADRQILSLLLGGVEEAGYHGYEGYGATASRYRLPEPLSPIVIPLVCATGRGRLRRAFEDETLSSLAWDDGPPWEFWLHVERGAEELTVEGSLRRGEERHALLEPALLTSGGLVFFADRVARLDHRGTYPWIRDLRHGKGLKLPAAEAPKLLETLLTAPGRPRVELPADLAYEEVAAVPRPSLAVKAPANRWSPPGLRCELSFEYEGTLLPEGQPGWGVLEPEKRRVLIRDREAEARAAARLKALRLKRPVDRGREAGERQIDPDRLPEVVRTLVQEGWRVEAEGKAYRRPGAVRLRVSTGIDWFDLEGSVDFEGTAVPLPRLLEAVRRGENTVTLDDGSVGLLPEEWLRRQSLLADLGKTQGDVVRFGRGQAGLLDALLAAEPEVDVDAAFARARARLGELALVHAADAPPGFRGELRGYQGEGLGWMHFLRELGFGGCLADDMGLGKTVQVLALLEARRGTAGKPSLVVVPKSLVFNWKQEAARFTPALRVLDHTGSERPRAAEDLGDTDVVLTTYGTLRRDVLLFKEVVFDYAVLDEAQAIKNRMTDAAKAVRLLKADHRLALSGTPVENHLGELQSLFDFLNPGLLGKGALLRKAQELDAQATNVLGRALRPFILRRTKDQVARDLPPKVEQTIFCDLPPEQRALCDELRDHYRRVLLPRVEREGLQKSKMHVLEALLRLRQAACHPGLLDRKRVDEPSAKLDELLPRLVELREEGHKALVFSQFTSFLALVRTRLEAAGLPFEYLDGKTRDRAARVRRFQEDEDCGLFLISLKAGGLGLNLTAAEYVFLLDPWWNPAVEAQAIDRSHRIGQSRQVFAYRLIARGTVEEKVLALQETKRKLADAILTADPGGLRGISKDDLELLLS